MPKKIDLKDIFDIKNEEEPLIINMDKLDGTEKMLLMERLYDDYIILKDQKVLPRKIARNYRNLLAELVQNYSH
jgi:hypothetical protein|tara:strand:+ start:355 stop:576 length:222 start_codon:yes stop_codon:yes gene_type:complete